MQLGDLLDDTSLDLVTSAIEITSVEVDSRQCSSGSLFVAVPGQRSDGRQFVSDAVSRGASCVLASEPVPTEVPVVVVPGSQMHAILSHVSATIVRHPERKAKLVGVTGTNGKTSVTNIVGSLATGLGWNAGTIGTLTNERTTPAPPELFRSLDRLVTQFDAANHHSVVALEVSSHALDQRRVEGLHFHVAAFTNLSHDHLDYHGTMERYFAAKATLFSPECAQRAVIWVDDAYGERLASMTRLPVTPVRRSDAQDVITTLEGTTFFWRDHVVSTPLVGSYNVDNSLLALAIVSALGGDDGEIAHAMSDVLPVPGRLNVLRGRGRFVVVDYAHTPAGLQRLLLDVRELNPSGRIITVFGCGGDRDRTKRPEMGLVASTLSDISLVTSDNPRSEPPSDIIDAVISGTEPGRDVRREPDRRQAISSAIALAREGDVVVIAGKGHETTQEFADGVVPFDDRIVAREFLG